MMASARGAEGAGSDRQARTLADLATRLTSRDRQLCRLLAEHRVLTSHQLTELAFNHLDTAEDRLRTLTTLEVLDRFRPRRDTGSAPYHYVLGPLGAALLAAEQGVGVADLGYRAKARLRERHTDPDGLTPEQVRNLLEQAGGLIEALTHSDPVLRSQLYEELGIDGVYDPGSHTVHVGVEFGRRIGRVGGGT
jgi:Replication-relaxation